MQAYLKESEQDLFKLREWVERRGTPVTIRLVKGAYWDYETVIAAQNDWPIPVWLEKWQSDACFERCSRFLLENYQWLRPAFGSHNVRSVSAALAVADELGVPPTAYEFQMLYGVRRDLQRELVQQGYRVRIYVPFGREWYPYFMRRLAERPANVMFILRNVVADR